MSLDTRLDRLERRRGVGRVGYPPPTFSDGHMLESVAVLLAALGEDALMTELVPRVGEEAAGELIALARA